MVKFMNENNYYDELNKLFDKVEEKLENKFYEEWDVLDWLCEKGYVKKVEVTYNQYYTETNDYLGNDYENCIEVYKQALERLKYDDKLEEILYDLKKEEQEGE